MKVAPAIAGPPFSHVVVAPDESVGDSEEVQAHHVGNEHHRRELSVSVQQAERHQADDDG